MKNNKLLKTLGQLDMIVAILVLVGLILLTFVGVFKRYLFRSPITWLEEIQMLAFMWVVFLGAAPAFRKGAHIAIEIVVDTLPKAIGGAIERFDVLLQLIILGYLTYQGFTYYFQLISAGKVTTLLRIPYQYAYAAVPIGCVLMVVSMLIGSYYQFVAKKDTEEGIEP